MPRGRKVKETEDTKKLHKAGDESATQSNVPVPQKPTAKRTAPRKKSDEKAMAETIILQSAGDEHLLGEGCVPDHDYQNAYEILQLTIESLNFWRSIFIGENTGESIGKGDKRAWWQMIQFLPSSYNQRRTVMLN